MSINPSNDLLTNVIHQQIKRGIRVCLDNECFGAAVILIYSGMDTLCSLSLPLAQGVHRLDFCRWADRYMSLCRSRDVTGDEFYSARCAMLHNYSVDSDMTRKGRCRQIGYMDDSMPAVRYDPSVAKGFVLVSVAALAQSFFDGIDEFLVDVFSDPAKASLAEARLEWVCNIYNSPRPAEGSK